MSEIATLLVVCPICAILGGVAGFAWGYTRGRVAGVTEQIDVARAVHEAIEAENAATLVSLEEERRKKNESEKARAWLDRWR